MSESAQPVVRSRGLKWQRPAGVDGSPGRMVLQGIDLDIAPQEVVAISGSSGVGKSVLGSLILRLRPVEHGGQVWWGEDEITGLSVLGLQGLRTRFQGLLQHTEAILPPFLTVGEALHESVRHVGRTNGARSEEVRDVAELLGISALLDRYPRYLSGGEQRKSGVARILLAHPRFAFVDEPDAGLDPLSQHDVLQALRRAVDRSGMGMLLVTHNAHLAEQYADRRVRLAEGRLHAE